MFLCLAKVKYDLIMDRPNEWQATYKFKNYTVIEVEMDPRRSCWLASAESQPLLKGIYTREKEKKEEEMQKSWEILLWAIMFIMLWETASWD